MFRTIKVGSLRGIDVYIHWTFWLLIAIYALSEISRNGLAAGIETALFVGAVFACVLAHEFGHAAAAAYYGIKTVDITLMLVGGVARLATIPTRPVQELVIALAGPAVNVVIGAVLFLALALGSLVLEPGPVLQSTMLFMTHLLIANVVLVVFNLLPAFPMDGGRVLRSLLAMRSGHLRATEMAAKVGRFMAALFAIAALALWEFPLLLLAGFVYFAGTAELMQVRMRSAAASGSGAVEFPFGSFVYTTSSSSGSYTSQPYDASYGYASQTPPEQDYRFRSRNDDVIDAVEVRKLPNE